MHVAGRKGCANGELGWDASAGYDLATGLGSLDGFALYTNWQNTSAGATTSTTVAASPSSLKMYGTTVLTATVNSGTAGTISGNVDFQVGDNCSGHGAGFGRDGNPERSDQRGQRLQRGFEYDLGNL